MDGRGQTFPCYTQGCSGEGIQVATCLVNKKQPEENPMTLNSRRITRRNALGTSLGMAMSLCPGAVSRAFGFESADARPRVGVIGCGVCWDKRVFVPDGRYGASKPSPRLWAAFVLSGVGAECVSWRYLVCCTPIRFRHS